MCENLLVRFTNSWWNGGNIYGKKTQMLTFPAGIDLYEKMCRQKLENWDGFVIDDKTKEKERTEELTDATRETLPVAVVVA
jgi:hypothetical protein